MLCLKHTAKQHIPVYLLQAAFVRTGSHPALLVSVRQANRLENDEGGRPEAAALAALLYNTEVMQKCAEKTHCCEHAFPEGNSRTEVIMARWLLCFSV